MQLCTENCTMENIFILLVILSQILALVILVLLGVWTGRELGGLVWGNSILQFNYHPLFMIIGLIVIYGEGTLVYRLFPKLSKFKVKLIHLTVQGIAVILGAVGLKAVFGAYGAVFNTVHTWIGLPTYLMFCLQWLCGFLIFFFPRLGEEYRRNYLPLHRYFGVALFAMAVVTAIAGIQLLLCYSDGNGSRVKIGNFLGVSIVSFALVIGYLVTNTSYKRTEPTRDSENQGRGRTRNYNSFLH